MKSMNKRAWLIILALSFFYGAQTAYSQQRRPCDGLSGAQRRSCLERTVARTTAEANRANERLQRLNFAMTRACNAAELLDVTADIAQTAGEVSFRHPLSYGGLTWTSVRAIMSRFSNEKRNCESARRAVADNRRRF
jgi:hypothetical protein